MVNNLWVFCRPLRGLGFFRGPDPRVTVAALAHPGLLSFAATRLVDANIGVDSFVGLALSLPAQPNKSLDASGGSMFRIMIGPAMLE